MHARRFVAAMAIALIAGSGIAAATAAGAGQLGLLDRPAKRLDRSIRNHQRQKSRAAKKRTHRREARYASLPGGVSRSTLEAIGSCESGGDPGAIDASGTYRGKYQFDYGTWASVGGSGDPAAAPEAEQDYRAAVLYSRSGSSPWPVCGV